MKRDLQTLALALVATVCLAAPVAAASPALRLEPEHVAPGEPATLTVTTDRPGGPPTLPKLDDLQITPSGQQQQLVQTNGQTTRSTSYLYTVRASEPGEHVIQGISIAGQALAPVTLHVDSGALPAAHVERERAFLRLKVERRELYAGESVPFTARAYIQGGTGATLNGAPAFTSDAFVVSGLDDKPKQSETTIDGQRYLVVTWRGVLTAAKPGQHALEMTLPLSLEYQERMPSARPRSSLRDLLGSPFAGDSPFDAIMNDPFFASAFDRSMLDPMLPDVFASGRVVQRDVTLRAGAAKASVRALPSAGRPDDFTGAVGQFEVDASLAASALRQGEPVDLQVKVKGEGNFERFTARGLPDSDGLRTYAPQSAFRASDGLGLRGTLTLTQPIAAKQSGDYELPSVRFSYFDPARAEYVTKLGPALAVKVAPSQPAAPIATREPAMQVESLQQGGVPTWLWPTTIAVLAFALIASLAIVGARSAHARHLLTRLRRGRELRQRRIQLDRAAEQGDLDGFVRVAHETMQQRLSEAWHTRPESVTAAELDSRWPSAPALLWQLFELADQARYGARRNLQPTPRKAELAAWARQLHDVLDHVEVHS
jgi:hypothetical protein